MLPHASFHALLTLLACAAPQLVAANVFLGSLGDAARGHGPELENSLLAALGDSRRPGGLERIEEALKPTFAALPKNEHGRLDHATVRYALHRLFVNQHGWFVQGLDPGGEQWSSGSPTAIVERGLPDGARGLLEAKIGQRGLGLREVAAMAALVEELVRQEAVERLRHTYRVLDRSERQPVSQEESKGVLDMYMVGYILGFNFTEVGAKEALSKRDRIEEAYPTWPETVKFLRDVQAASAPQTGDLSFDMLTEVIQSAGEQYGRWQDSECRVLKNQLVQLEDRGSGRVRLADFYRSAVVDGNWQFSESVDYLRQLGALDESDPRNLRVIIPNYISSPSNCVASSQYYSVCCLDECEGLLARLEEGVGAPHATQAQIVRLASAMGSATVAANRTLPNELVRKLSEVAQHHSNSIPLHGRLFKQWMHIAYPRECPFPHVTGTTRPQRALDWMAIAGLEVSASSEEMRQHMNAAPAKWPASKRGSDSLEDTCGLWSLEEELVSVHVGAPAADPSGGAAELRPALRGLALAAAAASASLAAAKTAMAAFGQASKKQPTKFRV